MSNKELRSRSDLGHVTEKLTIRVIDVDLDTGEVEYSLFYDKSGKVYYWSPSLPCDFTVLEQLFNGKSYLIHAIRDDNGCQHWIVCSGLTNGLNCGSTVGGIDQFCTHFPQTVQETTVSLTARERFERTKKSFAKASHDNGTQFESPRAIHKTNHHDAFLDNVLKLRMKTKEKDIVKSMDKMFGF